MKPSTQPHANSRSTLPNDERPDGDDVLDVEVFLVPRGVVLPTSVGRVVDIANLRELITALDATEAQGSFLIAHIEDAGLRTMIAKSPELIPVRAAVLTGVPGGDYDVLFDNSTYTLVSVPLVDVSSSLDGMIREANQQAQGILEGTTSTKAERIEKRSQRIQAGATLRNAASAPRPMSLADALESGTDGGDDDSED